MIQYVIAFAAMTLAAINALTNGTKRIVITAYWGIVTVYWAINIVKGMGII